MRQDVHKRGRKGREKSKEYTLQEESRRHCGSRSIDIMSYLQESRTHTVKKGKGDKQLSDRKIKIRD